MADMLVDSVKLDACLDAEADAIRAKTGGSSDIPFDYANNKGFADAIASIQTGGGGEEPSRQTVSFTLASGTGYTTILSTYIKWCAWWCIYPASAENTNLNTVAYGSGYPEGDTVTTPSGMSVSRPGQYKVNDQTYDATRTRASVNTKPAGDYIIEFYGIAKG